MIALVAEMSCHDCRLFRLAPTGRCRPTSTAPAPLASGIDTGGMDKTVRPQDDFYRYVNGRWLDQTEIPPDKAGTAPLPRSTTIRRRSCAVWLRTLLKYRSIQILTSRRSRTSTTVSWTNRAWKPPGAHR